MDNVTKDSLEKMFKGEGEKRFREIADRGGFGDVPVNHVGGLDVRGVLDPSNSALSDSQKSKLADLAGVSKDDRKRIDSGATTSSAGKMSKQENK